MKILALIKRFRNDERGATAIEYALMAAGIAVVIAGAITALGGGVSDKWDTIGNSMK